VKSLRIIAVAVGALALAGCVSLFPKAKPSQLYRFGSVAGAAAPRPVSQPVNIALGPVGFYQAASGDRILTMTGSEAAYIAQARWVEPASAMFTDALERGFEQKSQRVRLVDRRQATANSLVLNVDVDAFEARYQNGPKAAPTVVVSFTARIIRFPERSVVAEQRFTASRAAADNRVGAIVPAYDAALDTALGELTGWADQAVQR
jgi:cholesterol transport system auxiliary component